MLRASGQYTQPPGGAAGVFRRLREPLTFDSYAPAVGATVFYLLTGLSGNHESTLGFDSGGVERPNAVPCP